MKNKNIPIYLSIALAIGIFVGAFLNFSNKPSTFFVADSKEAKVKKLIDYIQYEYVDEVDTDSLLDEAILQMLKKLDPHSVYIPEEELQKVTENMQGNFVGIGVSFFMHKDSVTVIKALKGGPSEKAGLKAGDRILLADKDTLFGKNLGSNEIMSKLKGEPDTKVKLTIYRKSTDAIKVFKIKRDNVQITSVSPIYMINSNVGYIKINRFARTTYDEFKKSLDELIAKGMTSLILDLRGNPGGFIDIANKIVDEFLEDDKLIVFTKNKGGRIDKSYATSKGDFETGKLYVLINENSASASEIVAGALQDNDKGTIIGRRSFGKGLVQQEMELGDGSAVRLTTSRYYTPTGRSIQKPYDHSGSNKYDNDFIERIHNGELYNKDSIKVIDSLVYKTPKGKLVYGGGGITPDIFVAIDTSLYYNNYLYNNLYDFSFNYVDNNRSKFDGVSLEEFVINFDEDEDILNQYLMYLDHKAPFSEQSQKSLKMYLKAIIARQLYDDLGYYKVTQKEDNMIKKALELEQISNE